MQYMLAMLCSEAFAALLYGACRGLIADNHFWNH